MLVSTHNILVVREIFPCTIDLDNGCVVADGPTHELMNDQRFLEAHGMERP